MAAIAQICLPPNWAASSLWSLVADASARWLAAEGLPTRDAVLLLPFAALVEPARQAFVVRTGWMPRVETPQTLADALGPSPAPEPGRCYGDPVLDRLSARAMLRTLEWGRAWDERDPSGFLHAVSAIVDAASALRGAASQRAPEDREAFWQAARSAVGAGAGPAALESQLLRTALAWAAAGSSWPTDRLFDARPSAWIAVQVGGRDPLAEALLGHRGTPSLRIVADPPADALFADVTACGLVERIVCDDAEAEAQAAAASVIEALRAGEVPVAVVALDRALLRRVRALLRRASVPVLDETGWLLSTTPAAARLVALLRAAQPTASRDDRLAWLKQWPLAAPGEADALEAEWRGLRRPDPAAARRLLLRAEQHLAPLTGAGMRPLAQWLRVLSDLLAAEGSLSRMAADAAGQGVLRAIGLAGDATLPSSIWSHAFDDHPVDLPGLLNWVESTLADAEFLPPPEADASVAFTPLSRVFGRRFGRVVMPGADERRLGAVEPPPSLLGEAASAALGLPHAASRRAARRLALAHLARGTPLVLLRRARDADGSVGESPDVEWLWLARARCGLPAWPTRRWRPARESVSRRPVNPPQPRAADDLPATLSASRLEALRACPYRFFARAVLRLEEAEELDIGVAKRDYGTWLHAVLHEYHVCGGGDAAALRSAGDRVTAAMALEAGDLLPFRASFEHFVPAYLQWLRTREAAGWRWLEGEVEHELAPPGLSALALKGRIDRLDAGPGGARQLLDYKTGSVERLKQSVREPLEDTQLAFYAALLGPEPGQLGAAYLALDDAKAPVEVAHPEVAATAQALLRGLAGEWRRLREGEALPALGEGEVCDTCEARGLCRRDHWSAR